MAATSASLRLQIGLSFLAFILIGINDGAIGVLLPSLQRHYSVDKATVGLVFIAGTAGYLVSAFTSGLLTQKLGTRLFLALGAATFLLGAAAYALMLPFPLLLGMVLVFGFGLAIIDTGLNSHVARLPRNLALLNYLHAFYGVGALLGPLIASTVLALSLGWNTVYVLLVFLTLWLLVGFLLLFPRTDSATDEGETPESGNVLASVIKLRVVWMGALFLLLYVGSEASLGDWAYSFLTEERRQEAVFSGLVVSGYWLGLTLGRLLLARVAERVGSRRLIEGCLLGVALGVLLTWLGTGAVSAAGLCLTGFCLGPIYPGTIALTSELVPARLLASAVGVVSSMGSIGAAVLPWVAGNLAQTVGLWTLLPFVMGLTVLMLVSWAGLISTAHVKVVKE